MEPYQDRNLLHQERMSLKLEVPSAAVAAAEEVGLLAAEAGECMRGADRGSDCSSAAGTD